MSLPLSRRPGLPRRSVHEASALQQSRSLETKTIYSKTVWFLK